MSGTLEEAIKRLNTVIDRQTIVLHRIAAELSSIDSKLGTFDDSGSPLRQARAREVEQLNGYDSFP